MEVEIWLFLSILTIVASMAGILVLLEEVLEPRDNQTLGCRLQPGISQNLRIYMACMAQEVEAHPRRESKGTKIRKTNSPRIGRRRRPKSGRR